MGKKKPRAHLLFRIKWMGETFLHSSNVSLSITMWIRHFFNFLCGSVCVKKNILRENTFFIERSCYFRAFAVALVSQSLFWSCFSVEDGDWSTERSYVCTWNLDRRRVNPKQPDMAIETAAPVMCVSFHPLRPSLIAGQTCSQLFW